MKVTRTQLNQIIKEYVTSDEDILEEISLSSIGSSLSLGAFITRITFDVQTIAQKGNWKSAVRNIVKKAGSARKAMNNAYKILTSDLVDTVVNLSKGQYQKRVKQIAKNKGMSFSEFSKAYQVIDVEYLRQIVEYCDSRYPGILNDKLKRKFRQPLTSLMRRLNPHIDADRYFDAIFYGATLGTAPEPKPPTPPVLSDPPTPEEAAVEFFEGALSEEEQLIQDFLDDYYGYTDQSVDFDSLSDEEVNDISDAFYDMYGWDPRVSFLPEEEPIDPMEYGPPASALDDTSITVVDDQKAQPAAVKKAPTPS